MILLRRAARTLRGFLSRKLSPDVLKIGVSPRLFHPQPDAKGLQSKTLQYLEQSVAHWVMSRDVLVFMVPTVDKEGLIHRSNIRVADYARILDGLEVAAVLSVVGAVVGEFTSANAGIGHMILIASYRNDTPLLFAYVVMSAVCGLGLIGILRLVRRKVVFWE